MKAPPEAPVDEKKDLPSESSRQIFPSNLLTIILDVCSICRPAAASPIVEPEVPTPMATSAKKEVKEEPEYFGFLRFVCFGCVVSL